MHLQMFAGLGTQESVTVVPIGKCHVTSWDERLGAEVYSFTQREN